MSKMTQRKELLLLLIILVIAAFFRLWQLDKIPPGLYPDVAINGNDALETLKTGNFKVFYPENNGREGLFIWLITLSFSIFGVSIWSIKIVAALIGILTVLGLYLLTKELFKTINNQQLTINNEFVALLSSFFLAVSFWHVNFSRIGFRAILLPFILVFAFYFLFRGFRTPLLRQGFGGQEKLSNFIISGILFGLGFYTYISYRFILLLLPLTLLGWYFIYKKENLERKFLLSVVCCLLFVVLVASPIGIYFLQNPQDFIGRAAQTSIFNAQNPVKEFGKSLILHLAMFNFYGDPNWRHNFAGSPMLPWALGILFLIGLGISIKELINFRKHKNLSFVTEPPKEASGEKRANLSLSISHLSLVIWFFIMLLPGILTYEGIPHALRVIGVIPVVYIFAALGGFWVYEKLKILINRKLLFVLCSLFIVFIAYSEFNKYFFDWAKNPNVEGAFTKKFADIGYYLNSLPQKTSKYVIVNEPGVPVPKPDGIPMPVQTPMFIENTKYKKSQSIYLLPENLEKIKIDKETLIVPMKYDDNLFRELRQRFPEGEIKEENGVWIYEIK